MTNYLLNFFYNNVFYIGLIVILMGLLACNSNKMRKVALGSIAAVGIIVFGLVFNKYCFSNDIVYATLCNIVTFLCSFFGILEVVLIAQMYITQFIYSTGVLTYLFELMLTGALKFIFNFYSLVFVNLVRNFYLFAIEFKNSFLSYSYRKINNTTNTFFFLQVMRV